MTAWLDGGYRDSSPKAADSPYLFVSQLREKLSGTQINRIIRTIAEDAGIQEILSTDAAGRNQYKITSHTLRHSFAMHWQQNGGSIERLSKDLAHSSVTTTEIYGEILEDRAKDEYTEYAPKIDL